MKSPNGRLIRWALKLQSFDIGYEYTPGKQNALADMLSRPTCDESSKGECGVYSVTVDLPHYSTSYLREAQLQDPEIEKIIKDLENTDLLSANR